MIETEQLKLSVESTRQALNKLHLAITALQNAMTGMFAAITPEIMEQIAEPDEPDEPETPNTVGIKTTIKTHWDIANRIAESTDTVLHTLNPGEYNFGYYYTKGRFVEVYRLLVKDIVGWIADKVIDVGLSKAVSHIMLTVGSEGHAFAFQEYLATKKLTTSEEKLASICTPRGIAEAIAAATNLELFDGGVKDYYQIGYRTPIGTFMQVTEFRHDDILGMIVTKSVNTWMKATVANIIEKTQGLKAVDDYRKRKVTR